MSGDGLSAMHQTSAARINQMDDARTAASSPTINAAAGLRPAAVINPSTPYESR
jgi:hypothetical protein